MAMHDATKDYAAGFAAGVATVSIGHPFDTLKVKLQTQNTEVNTAKYRNALHCAIDILKTGGIKSFYKGPDAVLFGMVDNSWKGRECSEPKLSSIVPAAAIGGACISMILCPTELVKCRLQVQANNGRGSSSYGLVKYDGPLDCVQKTIRNDGLRGLFKGGISTVMRECVGNSVFFMTYEFSRHHLLSALKHDNNSKELQSISNARQKYVYGNTFSKVIVEGAVDIFCGGLAGMVFWTVVLPFDVAKTRIQTAIDPKLSRNPIYNLKMIHKELGVQGLYAGLGPTLARAFPANAAAMVTWELTARLLGVQRHESRA